MALELMLDFHSVDEARLGPKWQGCFNAIWPAYRRWFLSQGEGERPTYRQGVRALREHMPEFMPMYEQMNDLAGGGDFAARFLSQFNPPPFFAACSQAVLVDKEPVLVRNYDYSPLLCDGLIMKTKWNRQSVIAMTDCMSGVLDGMNKAGLAISLTFGGRKAVGDGFGITLVQRYILESCETVAEATETLCRIPVQVAYNVTVVDKQGDYATVMLSPDRDPVVSQQRIATNHQNGDRWESYTTMIESDARYAFLESRLPEAEADPDAFIDLFLAPPLFRDTYSMGYGTIFTSVYYPQRGEVQYRWVDDTWKFSFDDFQERTRKVCFSDPAASQADAPMWPASHRDMAHLSMGFIAP